MKRLAHFAAVSLSIVAMATTVRAEETDHADHRHSSIRITSGGLRMQQTNLKSEDAIVFLNYSGRIAQISFDESVAKSIACKNRSAFELSNGRLTAANVRQGSFVSLCTLSDGSYDYRVELKRSAGEVENYAVHEGKIVVQP